jgi:uncharacterized protein (DUF486 family)
VRFDRIRCHFISPVKNQSFEVLAEIQLKIAEEVITRTFFENVTDGFLHPSIQWSNRKWSKHSVK